MIAARIDRLAEAPKLTLQLASVIGREFSRRLVDRVSQIGNRVHQLPSEPAGPSDLAVRPELLAALGYAGPAAGAARAFKELSQGLDVAIVRVLVARSGNMEAVRATMRAALA